MKKDMMDHFVELAGLPPVSAQAPLTEDVDLLGALLEQDGGTKDAIEALRDTDYKDPEAHFKMVQLLKGLAVAAKDDDTAKKFMDEVSDALTAAGKKVLGEQDEEDDEDDDEDEDGDEEDDDEADEGCDTPGMKKRSKGKGRGLARGDGKGPIGVPVGEK